MIWNMTPYKTIILKDYNLVQNLNAISHQNYLNLPNRQLRNDGIFLRWTSSRQDKTNSTFRYARIFHFQFSGEQDFYHPLIKSYAN